MHRYLVILGILSIVFQAFGTIGLATAEDSEVTTPTDSQDKDIETILSSLRANRSPEFIDSVIPDIYSEYADKLFNPSAPVAVPFSGAQAVANVTGERFADYEIKLRSRFFTPAEGIATALLGKAEGGHVIIQFHDSPRDKQIFEGDGILLLSYLPHNSFSAYVPASGYTALEASSLVRAVIPIEVDDKICPLIRDNGIPGSLRNSDGTVRLVVLGFADESKPYLESILTAYGTITSVSSRKNMFALSMRENLIPELAAEDAIQWIERGTLDNETHMDEARATINADPVQAAPYNLDADGVTVAIWDEGWADTGHDDFAGRIVRGDTGSFNASHSTHVAGIMAGDGALSEGTLRGIATEADIRTYDWPDLTDFDNLDDETENAIDNGAILSQNSWSLGVSAGRLNCDEHGNYSAWSTRYDEIINGTLGDEIAIICSSGNEENDGDCPPYPWDQLNPPMATSKNAICVGAVYSDTEGHTCFSSRGPTNDGRLKPDLVAPGDEETDNATPCLTGDEIRSCVPGDSYGEKGGTSMSAPQVSGTIGLLRQQFTQLGYGEIKPFTYRAILALTADDLGNPGADYTNGHGMLNTQAAVDLVRDNFPNNEMIQTDTVVDDDIVSYYMSVPPGSGPLRVALAWDDVEGNPASAVMLVNDLDLYLRSPGNTSFYAYQLDPDNPNDIAGTGWNALDNLEVVQVDDPEPGLWEVRVWAWQIPVGSEEYTVAMPYEHIQCGDIIYHDTHLAEDLVCTGAGLIIGADDVTLYGHDFTISGDGGTGDYGVIVNNLENVTIQDCVIDNFRNGVYVSNSDSCLIGPYNIISNCYAAVHYENSDYGVIGANTIVDNSDYGLNIINSNYNGIGILNNISTSKRAIVFTGGSHDNSLLWNSVHDNAFYGILYSTDVAENQASSCVFFGNQYGLRLYGSGTGNNITDCNIYENGYGIHAYDTSNFTIDECEIYDNTDYGIRLESNTTGIGVTDCRVCGNLIDISENGANSGDRNYCTDVVNWADNGQSSGCDWQCGGCRQPEDGLIISENTTLCPGTYNIPDADGQTGVVRVDAAYVTVIAEGVTLTGDESGSGFYTSQHGVNFIGGRAINYNFGYHMISAEQCSLYACHALASNANGFFISNSPDNLFDNCLAADNGAYGFSCAGGGGNEFNGCEAENNSKGFYFTGSNNNTVYNCDVTYNDEGVTVFNSNNNLFWFNRFAGNDISANEFPAGVLNDWNTTVGNLWDDFAANEGYPFTYVIPGAGDGIDYHPTGAHITVKPDGTGDYPTIQEAINAATGNQVILLTDGVFTGDNNRDLDFLGKEIIIQSVSGNPAACIIDCEGAPGDPHRCVIFNNGEDAGTVLQGVTLTNGNLAYGHIGANIFCAHSSPTINNCIISNGLGSWGGGLYCLNASPVVTDCVFADNDASNGGAVYATTTSNVTFDRVTFAGNTSVNLGSAILIIDVSNVTLNNCTIVDNHGAGGAITIAAPDGSHLEANSTIIYGNSAYAFSCSSPGHADLICCNVSGNAGGDYSFGIEAMEGINGNISLVPLFCDYDNRELTLRSNSPCAPFSAPNPECDLIGAWPVDCGALSDAPADDLAPSAVFLSPCRPNPSSMGTRISYGVSARAGTAPVSLKIYDATGHLMRTLVDGAQVQGYYNVEWRGFDDAGKQVPGGVYFYQLVVDEKRLSQRVIMLR